MSIVASLHVLAFTLNSEQESGESLGLARTSCGTERDAIGEADPTKPNENPAHGEVS